MVRIPRRPDRRDAEAEAAGRPAASPARVLPFDDRRAVEVRRERVGVRDVRRRRAAPRGRATTISDEDAEHRHRDPVAPQPAAGERPGARPRRARRRRPRGRLARERSLTGSGPSGGRARARPPRTSLLDPRLVDEPVELLAEREVADALRDEVDVLRVEQRRHRRLVGHLLVDLRPLGVGAPPRS